jgi:DNA helicase-2/ATP-dependent DNA helicase PcrA
MAAVRPNMSPITYFGEVDSDVMVRVLGSLIADPRAGNTNRAVLARNHVLLKKLSMLLTDSGIKHQYIGKRAGLTNTETFRRFHAFLKLAINPYDNFAMLMIRQVLGMSHRDYGVLRLKAMELGKSLFQTWRESDTMPGREFSDLYDAMEAGNISNVLDWSENLLIRFRNQDTYHDTMGFIADYADPYGESVPSVEQYLEWLATIDIQDEIIEGVDGLMLMTVHAAKGLEWPTVLIAGMNEGLLPSKQAIKNDEVEQERRLCYVAMTRARDSLILTSRPEITHTEYKTYENPISRFIREALQPEKEEKEPAAC